MLDDKLKYILIKDLNTVLESVVSKAKTSDETLNRYNVEGLIFTTTKANSNVYYVAVPEELRVIYNFGSNIEPTVNEDIEESLPVDAPAESFETVEEVN